AGEKHVVYVAIQHVDKGRSLRINYGREYFKDYIPVPLYPDDTHESPAVQFHTRLKKKYKYKIADKKTSDTVFRMLDLGRSLPVSSSSSSVGFSPEDWDVYIAPKSQNSGNAFVYLCKKPEKCTSEEAAQPPVV